MQDFLDESAALERANRENFLSEDVLERFRAFNQKCSGMVVKLAKKKNIWKHDKFRISRKVKIAESYNDLLSHS